MLAQPRAFRLPAADAVVDVVALGEDPAVAARDRPELDEGEAAVALVERRVAFEGDAVGDRPAEAERLRGRPVRAVGARRSTSAVERRSRASDLHAVAELRARRPPPARRGTRRAAAAASSARTARACPVRSNRERQPSRNAIRSTSCSTTGAGSTGSCRTARSVSPPPHGLSRGNVALSTSSTRRRPRGRGGWRSPTPRGRLRSRRRRSAPRRRVLRRRARHAGSASEVRLARFKWPERPAGTLDSGSLSDSEGGES